MSQLRLRLLGGFQTSVEGELITATYTPRLQSLIGYLVLHRDAAHTRQQLAFLLWPDSGENQARTNLRKLIPQLRDASFALARCIHEVGQTLQWRTDGSVFVDVIEFEQAVVNGAFERAVSVYAGDLLPTCDEEWLAPERERLNRLFSDALRQRIAALESQRDYHSAITQAQRLLQLDVLDETAYSTLMRLHALNGDRASAVRIYLACEHTLKRELGIEPSAETHDLYTQLAHLARDEAAKPFHRLGVASQKGALVGRIEEWKHLLQVWEQTADQPQCAILMGEAGIGKTRLAEELIEWANRQGILTATGRCYAAEGALAYAPITAWLRSDGIRTAFEQLDAVWLTEVTRLLPELLTQFPTLPRPDPLTEGWPRQRFFEALARAFLTSGKPCILLLDDLQWCDRETLEWIRYGLHFDASSRWMIVGTVRIEEVDDAHPLIDFLRTMRQTHAYAEIELGPLTEEETASLAMRLAGRALAATQLTQLYRETEGNPLFVTETIASNEWMHTLNQGSAEAEPISSTSHTPPTILAVIHRRLSALSPDALEATRFAAVMGRGFTPQLLAHASGQDEDHVVHALEEMLRKHIVQEHSTQTQSRGIGDEYDFRHDKIREAAYHGLSTARRRLQHRQVAEALIRMYSPDLDSVSGHIASHYERAGIADLAIQYFVRAALASRQICANSEAMRLCRRAEAQLKGLSTASALRSEVATLRECLGDLLYMSNQLAEAIAEFQQAIQTVPASSRVLQAGLLCKIGVAQIMVRQLDEADHTLYQALDTLGEVSRYEEPAWRRQWLNIQDAWLTFNYWCNRPDDSIEILEHIRPIVEQYGTIAEQVTLYRSFTMARIRADRYVASDELMQMVHTLDRLLQTSAKAPANPETLAYNAFTMGFLYLWAGEMDVAEPRLLDAAQSAEHIGALGIWSPALNYLTLIDRLRGDVEKVEAALVRCREIAEQARKPEYALQVGGGNVKLVIGSSQDVTARDQWEAALHRSEEENQRILESLREGFLALDQNGRFIYINQHAANLLGLSANDLLGKMIQEQYPELVGSKFERVYRQAMHEKVISSVTAFYANHGRWYDVCAYPAENGITIYFKDVTEHVRAEETIRAAYSLLDQRVQERTEKLMAENQIRQALIRKMVEAQETERARIAREIHEDTAQQLITLIFGLHSLKTLELPAQAQESVDLLIPAAHEFIAKVHRLVDDLRTPLLDLFGLEAALQDYAEKWQPWSQVPIMIDCRGFEGRRLSSAIEIVLYRIVQEALTNITQHAAGVTQVRVSVVWQGDEVITTIEDNGSGFEITPLKQHLGLQTMEERASLLGGALSIESTLGRGTRIGVQLPALVG